MGGTHSFEKRQTYVDMVDQRLEVVGISYKDNGWATWATNRSPEAHPDLSYAGTSGSAADTAFHNRFAWRK